MSSSSSASQNASGKRMITHAGEPSDQSASTSSALIHYPTLEEGEDFHEGANEGDDDEAEWIWLALDPQNITDKDFPKARADAMEFVKEHGDNVLHKAAAYMDTTSPSDYQRLYKGIALLVHPDRHPDSVDDANAAIEHLKVARQSLPKEPDYAQPTKFDLGRWDNKGVKACIQELKESPNNTETDRKLKAYNAAIEKQNVKNQLAEAQGLIPIEFLRSQYKNLKAAKRDSLPVVIEQLCEWHQEECRKRGYPDHFVWNDADMAASKKAGKAKQSQSSQVDADGDLVQMGDGQTEDELGHEEAGVDDEHGDANSDAGLVGSSKIKEEPAEEDGAVSGIEEDATSDDDEEELPGMSYPAYKEAIGLSTSVSTIKAWKPGSRGNHVITMYGPKSHAIFRLEAASEVVGFDYTDPTIPNVLASGHRYGEQKVDRKWKYTSVHFDCFMAVAFKGDDVSIIDPKDTERKRYSETHVWIQWKNIEAEGGRLRSWETRTTLRRVWPSRAVSSADEAIFIQATKAEEAYQRWQARSGEGRDVTMTPMRATPKPPGPKTAKDAQTLNVGSEATTATKPSRKSVRLKQNMSPESDMSTDSNSSVDLQGALPSPRTTPDPSRSGEPSVRSKKGQKGVFDVEAWMADYCLLYGPKENYNDKERRDMVSALRSERAEHEKGHEAV